MVPPSKSVPIDFTLDIIEIKQKLQGFFHFKLKDTHTHKHTHRHTHTPMKSPLLAGVGKWGLRQV